MYVDELTEVNLATEEGETPEPPVQQITIGEGAFSYCENLTKVTGLCYVVKFDSYAFAYAPLTNLDLSNATYIGDHAFMRKEYTDVKVTLGKVEYIGENPFAMCKLSPFSKVETESFNGNDYEITTYTFDISDTVKVIEGSIYKVVKNGLVMVAYAGETDSITVADTTVRISALAFAGSDIKKVVLPGTVASIGHKAFYDCKNLTVVSFSSYKAPILEEEYDYSYYASMENLPATGDYEFTDVNGNPVIIPGLGITEYFMYNVTSTPVNIYYGANFVDYIGHISNKIVMVRPANGQNYGSFIWGQYFNVVIDGDIAPDDITLSVIEAINNLPEKVSLSDKHLVVLARELYNKIMTNEQKSIVDENGLYAKLTSAEKRISDLEYLQNEDNQTPDQPNEGGNGDTQDTPKENKLPSGAIAAIVVLSVVAFISVVGLIILTLDGKEKKITKKLFGKTEKTTELTEEKSEEKSEEKPEEKPVEKENDNTTGEDNEQ